MDDPPVSRPVVLRVPPRVGPADVPALRRRLRALLAGHRPGIVVCDVGALAARDAAPIDMGTVDALARLALAVRRLGGEMRLRGASGELRDLVGFCGLSEALPCAADGVSRGAPAARTAGRNARCRGRT